MKIPLEILSLMTRVALDGAADADLTPAAIARRVKVPAAELTNGHLRALTERQLESIAAAANLSLPELLVRGDPTGERLGFTSAEQRSTARVFKGLRECDTMGRRMARPDKTAYSAPGR